MICIFSQTAVQGNREAFLSREEVKAMVDSGLWKIQSHGHTHALGYYCPGGTAGFYPDADHWSLSFALDESPFPGAPVGELVSALACQRRMLAPELKRMLREGNATAGRIVNGNRNLLVEAETAEEYQERLKADMERNCCEIAAITGERPKLLFWPWGD